MTKIKKRKTLKNVSWKENVHLMAIQNCLETAQMENKTNHLEKM